MKTGQFVIIFEEGLHARPASILVRICNEIKSDIEIIKDDMIANPKSILEIMALGAATGEMISVTVKGEDEEEAFKTISDFFENKE